MKGKPPAEAAEALKGSGAGIIQLRDKESCISSLLKDAYAVRKALAGSRTLFIVNDYIDIAAITDSDGIHLGQDDASIEAARRILGRDKLIGISCHSLNQAINAEKRGADYIGVGPVFATATKPGHRPVGLELVRQVSSSIKIPFFAIGGINRSNIAAVLASGANRVAASSAVCGQKDIKKAARALYGALRQGY